MNIVWENLPPDTQTYDIENDLITWNIKAIPDPDYIPTGIPIEDEEPVITNYEIVSNGFRDTVIINVDLISGVTITGNVGNPFPFVNIAYVRPKNGTEKFSVGFVENLPIDGDYDLYEWIQSSTTKRSDYITIKVTSTSNVLEDSFELITNNNWNNGRDTLIGLL